jgi:hypothetical protein
MQRQGTREPGLAVPGQRPVIHEISLGEYNIAMQESGPKRNREPRVRDNPMALLAHQVMVEAERALKRADALAAAMEPHLLKRVKNSAIYGYTNDREDRNVPPGDVLLAAALVTGISLDEKLGLVRQRNEMGEMRVQMAEMRQQIAQLQAELAGRNGETADRSDAPVDPLAAARAQRAAERRAWAEGSSAAEQPAPPTPDTGRSSGRRP